MKCEICQRGPAPEHGGVTVYRQNPTGEIGVWRCSKHNVAPIEPDVADLVRVLEQPAPAAHQEREGNRMELKAGDIVVLKSDPTVRMTVASTDETYRKAETHWFVGSELQGGRFPFVALKLAAHQERTEPPKCCEGTMAGSHDPACQYFGKSSEILRALGNCYMMAKREIARILNGKSQTDATSLERWQHVKRFCEEAGCTSSILRASLPTEMTEGESGAPARAAEWQPLETVPADVEFIIAAWPMEDDADLPFEVGEAFRDGGGWLCAATNTRIEPTHWMPLPLPPGALAG